MFISIVLSFFGLLASSEAYEACAFVKNGSVLLYCADKGAYIGYCCNYNPTLEVETNCCYYTAWYGLWYLWLCVFAFILLVSLCGACCKRAAEAKRVNSARSSMSSNQGTTYETAAYSVPQGNTEAVVTLEDNPPAYSDIQKQGVQAQHAEMAGYGSQQNSGQS